MSPILAFFIIDYVAFAMSRLDHVNTLLTPELM